MDTELAEKSAGVCWQQVEVRHVLTCFTSTSVQILTPEELADVLLEQVHSAPPSAASKLLTKPLHRLAT